MLSEVLAKEIDIPLNDYYICYFDVLGYKNAFEKPEEHKQFLFNMLLSTDSIESIIRNENTYIQVQYRTYSDNFLLFFEKGNVGEYEALKLLSTIARKIQMKFLIDHKIIVRGGITIGEFYADDKMVFGQGLIRAVELEDKIAKYPRIIIDNECFQESVSKLVETRYILQDNDGLFYINYFHAQEALLLERGYCISLINTNCKYQYNVKDELKIAQKEKTITKYLWMLIKFNEACKAIKKESLQIEYQLKINEKILKLEIYCEK